MYLHHFLRVVISFYKLFGELFCELHLSLYGCIVYRSLRVQRAFLTYVNFISRAKAKGFRLGADVWWVTWTSQYGGLGTLAQAFSK